MTQPAPDQQPAIAAAIIVHDGKVLLVKRRISEGALSWQFPAGAIEHGENALQAAAREAQEETGLTVTPTTILGERIHPNTGRTMIYVACTLTETQQARITDEDELTEYAWSDRNSLTTYVPYPLYPPVQEHLNTTLN